MEDSIRSILQMALTPEGAGVIMWLVVGAFLKAVPQASAAFRFWFAYSMAFVIPPAAVLLSVWLGYDHLTKERLLYAVGIGFLVSQGVHWGSQQLERSAVDRALKKSVAIEPSPQTQPTTLAVPVGDELAVAHFDVPTPPVPPVPTWQPLAPVDVDVEGSAPAVVLDEQLQK